MGRFATAADYYNYREPYPPEFFAHVASRLLLNPKTTMLDIGCGPGNLAIGFAPFVGACVAIDIEHTMLSAAVAAAKAANVKIFFIQQAIEQLFPAPDSYDFVTIGRALHWLSPELTLGVLEKIVSPEGRIAICGSIASDSPVNAWNEEFRRVRRAWASDPDESKYRIDVGHWFAHSGFRKLDEVQVLHRHRVSVPHLLARALSFSNASPEVLAERRPEFEAEIASALAPFATDNSVEEELLVKATIVGRT